MAAVKSSELDVLSKTPSSISSSGSGCRRISSLRLLKASVWAFETSTSCVSELCKPCKTLAMSASCLSPQSWKSWHWNLFFPCRQRSCSLTEASFSEVQKEFFRISFSKNFCCLPTARTISFPEPALPLSSGTGTRSSGINRFRSQFHWLKSEHAQFDRK